MTRIIRVCGLSGLIAMAAAAAPLGGASADDVRILQTNSRDDTIMLIDPATRAIVAEITGVPANHGVAVSPDGSRIYASSEAKVTLDVIDGETLEIIEEIPLAARPNNIDIANDGGHVFVGIMGEIGDTGWGGIQVIDTEAMEVVHTIDTMSRVHNVYVTPDGGHVVAGAFGADENLQVFDAETWEPAFSLYPKRNESRMEGIRPIAFSTNPDGSTKTMFVQQSDVHGFMAVDWETREEIARVELPSLPEDEQAEGPFNNAPAHGIGVAPDQQTLWVCSRLNGYVYAYSLPDLEYLGGVEVGSHPDWLTFTPDSQYVYVANGYSDDVSVVDIATLEEVERLQVGGAPKRNITAVLP